MAKIRMMSEALANKIAAGEVVERPASVVKELVENALDADASQITVELMGPGCRTIRVVDNGTGMDEDDVLLAIERHATSKISSDADLSAIQTLGFRGEALPSMAAVSRFELKSKIRESTEGTWVRVDGGVVKQVAQCGCPPGTQVWVRDLFFNQPARRKFLKRERTEFAHVVDTLTRLALGRPDVHFSLQQRNRQSHVWPAAVDLQQRLAQVFQKRLTQSWVPISHRRGVLEISGYMSPPELHRSNSRMLFLYVNRRAVRDRLLMIALLEAYRTLIPKGQFPLGVVFLELPPERVDVNVHPTKAEVRFQDPQELYKAITSAARTALTGADKKRWKRSLAAVSRVKSATAPGQQGLGFSLREDPGIAEPRLPTYEQLHSIGTGFPTTTQVMSPAEAQQQELGTFFGELTVIGQLHHSYILCEAPDGLILIDQHAAHERVFFETFLREATAGQLASQALMVAETVELTAEEAAWLEESLEMFEKLGFTLDPFGSHTFVIRTVPAVALRREPQGLLLDLVSAGYKGVSDPAPELLLENLLQSMACRVAVKAGQRLGQEEISALLQQLDGLDHCSTCPHGRPLWWKLTIGEVERMFSRT
jgi:DNA mismatch repair protein MutL